MRRPRMKKKEKKEKKRTNERGEEEEEEEKEIEARGTTFQLEPGWEASSLGKPTPLPFYISPTTKAAILNDRKTTDLFV